MLDGPLTTGRMIPCRYTPPDRSEEIPVELRTMPDKEETPDKEEAPADHDDHEAAAATDETVPAEDLALD